MNSFSNHRHPIKMIIYCTSVLGFHEVCVVLQQVSKRHTTTSTSSSFLSQFTLNIFPSFNPFLYSNFTFSFHLPTYLSLKLSTVPYISARDIFPLPLNFSILHIPTSSIPFPFPLDNAWLPFYMTSVYGREGCVLLMYVNQAVQGNVDIKGKLCSFLFNRNR